MFEIDKEKKNRRMQLPNNQIIPRNRPMYLDLKFSILTDENTDEGIGDNTNIQTNNTTLNNFNNNP